MCYSRVSQDCFRAVLLLLIFSVPTISFGQKSFLEAAFERLQVQQDDVGQSMEFVLKSDQDHAVIGVFKDKNGSGANRFAIMVSESDRLEAGNALKSGWIDHTFMVEMIYQFVQGENIQSRYGWGRNGLTIPAGVRTIPNFSREDVNRHGMYHSAINFAQTKYLRASNMEEAQTLIIDEGTTMEVVVTPVSVPLSSKGSPKNKLPILPYYTHFGVSNLLPHWN